MDDKYSPVFAIKNYPVDGIGGSSENVARSMIVFAVRWMLEKKDLERTGVFCDRFFLTQLGAAKWLQMRGGVIDFKKTLANPLASATLDPLEVNADVVVGAIVVRQNAVERMTFTSPVDYVNFLNAHARQFANMSHVVFRMFARDREVAEQWTRDYCVGSEVDLVKQALPVLKWL